MVKKLCIHIDIDARYDSPSRVKDLICSIIEVANDNVFAVESVTIDGEENFKNGIGWMNTLKKRQV